MASVPVPRSYAQIVGNMLDALLSKLGLPSVRVGSPALSIIEAAAQSDLRSSQDIFNLLNSSSLDRATGNALDRLGADENTPRIAESPASGFVTIVDSSFNKLQTKIFQGLAAPIIGSTVIFVADATLFPASGAIYIGRGTTNYEGPLTYSSKVNNTNYWTLNLAGGQNTRNYHNLGEPVVLAQGGNRLVPAGTVVQTPQGNAGSSVQFSTLFSATIPDGETQLTNVTVVAQLPGTIGNVIAGSIKAFASPPFTGATVTNPLPYSNGKATETDNDYRERIRNVRQSRSKGTPLAITTNVVGITASDENKTVISASVVSRAGFPTTLYIDDGTGYEESSIGIAYEALTDQALGGEQYFQLVDGRPVTKAHTDTQLAAPFSLTPSCVLAVLVGGVLSTHLFSASDFRSIGSASAYEVAASINGDPNCTFGARVINSGTQVAVFARADTNEDVQVVVPEGFPDANPFLGFPAGRVDSLRLYKNDRLLFKDGQLASITSNPQGQWAPTSSGETLAIIVDGILIPPSLSTIVDADFVNAGTGFTSVASSNSLDAWAQVLNFKIPGITATVTSGSLTLTSNLGRNSAASVAIGSCSLVSKGVFSIVSSQGKTFDYELDRNLGQIRLSDSLVLAANDKLTAGSLATRGFLESGNISTITINSVATSMAGQNGAELWFAVDGGATLVKTGVGPGTQITYSIQATSSWGKRVRLTATAAVWTNVSLESGMWVVVNDSAVPAANQGAWQIANVDPGGTWIEIEVPSSWVYTSTINLSTGGVIVVQSRAELQRVFIAAAANYTASSLVAAIALRGATASTYRTTKIRVRTNRFALGGDIALVAANSEGLKLTLPVASATINQTSHLASVEAGSPELGTPAFEVDTVSSTADASDITMTALNQINSGSIMVGLKALDDSGGGRVTNRGHVSPIAVISGTSLNLRRPAVENWYVGDRLYPASHYALTAVDQMTVVIDQDTTSHRFVMPMYRRCHPASGTYGSTITLQDADNGNASLAETFGTGMNWLDFAVFMHARTKSSLSAGADTNKTILWRYTRLGPDGNNARIAYTYPLAPSKALNVTANALLDQYTDIYVQLPSGAARTGVQDSNTTKIGYGVTAGPSGGLYTYTYVFNLPIATAAREVRLNYSAKTAGWSVGETVTGQTSAATGVIGSIVGGGSGGVSGTVIFSSNTGTFVNGELLNGSVSGAGVANASGSNYGVSKLSLTLPSGFTGHGFSVGNQVYISYNSTGTTAGFISGLKTILETPSGTQINYVESNSAIASTANVGTVSYDSAPVGLGSSTVVTTDIFNVGVGTSLPSAFQQSIQLQSVASGNVTGQSPTAGSLATNILWASINNTSNISFFPLDTANCTILQIASVVNGLANSPVTAVAVGTGLDTSGSILYATYETPPNGLGGTNPWYYFSDGLNYVRSTNTPGSPSTDFVFTLKDPTAASLATNSDFSNEDVRLVPITADNVVNYLNTPGPGGLFASGEIVVANQGGRPQIATLTVGSSGSVQVQGGTGNEITSAVLGSAIPVSSSYMVVNAAATDTIGMAAGHWMEIQNTSPVTKNRITSSTALTSISADGTVILSGTTAWDWAGSTTGPITGTKWQIEKHGNFVAFAYSSLSVPVLTGVSEGDWVHISGALGGTVSARNQGLFRIVRIDTANHIFWIVNPNVLEEVQTADLAFLAYDSIVPGDKFIINTPLWGLNNLGTWEVASIDLTTYNVSNTNNTFKFKLNVSTRTPQVVGAVGALGASAGLIQAVEGQPSVLYKRIQGINVDTSNPNNANIKFDSQAGYQKVSAAAGSIMSSMDKLAFPTSLNTGIDGYQHSIGLIAEANKVGYGDETDTATYPGVIAAGAVVNIQGPLVRRIQVSLSVRTQTGVSSQDIEDQIKSSVASLINGTGVGSPIAISEIVSVAQAVNGVVSVTVLSPTFGPGNDLISIQPFEKPLVLNLDQDVLVSFVGA